MMRWPWSRQGEGCTHKWRTSTKGQYTQWTNPPDGTYRYIEVCLDCNALSWSAVESVDETGIVQRPVDVNEESASPATKGTGDDPEHQHENGASLIAIERRRQVEVEGWGAGHDKEHGGDELVMAAVAYALPYFYKGREDFWPWDESYWKPVETGPNQPRENRIRELVKAGALIAAEIDRLLPQPEGGE